MFIFVKFNLRHFKFKKKQHTHAIVSFQYAKVHSKPFHFHDKKGTFVIFSPSISEMATRGDANAINLYI